MGRSDMPHHPAFRRFLQCNAGKLRPGAPLRRPEPERCGDNCQKCVSHNSEGQTAFRGNWAVCGSACGPASHLGAANAAAMIRASEKIFQTRSAVE